MQNKSIMFSNGTVFNTLISINLNLQTEEACFKLYKNKHTLHFPLNVVSEACVSNMYTYVA